MQSISAELEKVRKSDLNIDGISTEQSVCTQFLREYIDYRVDNDPAHKLLCAAFGDAWTNEVLRTVVFPPIDQ